MDLEYRHNLTDVLILPQRVVPRLADLDHEEVSDLFQSAQTVGKALESAYNAQALTISLQVCSFTQFTLTIHGVNMPYRG